MRRLALVAGLLIGAGAQLGAFPIVSYVQISTGAKQSGGFNLQTSTLTKLCFDDNSCQSTAGGGSGSTDTVKLYPLGATSARQFGNFDVYNATIGFIYAQGTPTLGSILGFPANCLQADASGHVTGIGGPCGSSNGVVSPGTFTWVNSGFGILVSTLQFQNYLINQANHHSYIDNSVNGSVFLGNNTGVISGDGGSNTAIGALGQLNITSGVANTSVGSSILQLISTSSYNTALGLQSMDTLFAGDGNTAIGAYSGSSLGSTNFVYGSSNVFIGYNASMLPPLFGPITNTVVIGANAHASASNTAIIGGDPGTFNTMNLHVSSITTSDIAFPDGSVWVNNGGITTSSATISSMTLQGTIYDKSTGHSIFRYIAAKGDLLAGEQTADSPGSGFANVGYGPFGFINLTSGGSNVGVGANILQQTTSGSNNTAMGGVSLEAVTTGSGNTALGFSSGYNNGTGQGIVTGSSNTFIGYNAGTTNTSLSNGIAIGANTIVATNNTTVLGGAPGTFNTQNLVVSSITVAGLTSGQCVQTGTGGLLTVTGSACGAGGGGVAGGGTINVSTLGTVGYYSGSSTNIISGITPGTSGQILSTGGNGVAPFWTSNIPSGSSNYIQNTATLQSGATFYVSSGTVNGKLTSGSLSVNGRFLHDGNAVTQTASSASEPVTMYTMSMTSGGGGGASDRGMLVSLTSGGGTDGVTAGQFNATGGASGNATGLSVAASGGATNNAIAVTAGNVNLSPLTASQFVKTDSLKNLSSYDLFSGTDVWTGGATRQSSTTFNGNVNVSSGLVLSGVAGSNGQVLTSGGAGSVPSWTTVSGSGASLSSTNTWTAGQTFTSSVTISSSLVLNAGSGNASITENGLTGQLILSTGTPTNGQLAIFFSSMSVGSSGLTNTVLAVDGSGVVIATVPAGSGTGDVVKASTQVFTGGNTFQSSTTFNGPINQSYLGSGAGAVFLSSAVVSDFSSVTAIHATGAAVSGNGGTFQRGLWGSCVGGPSTSRCSGVYGDASAVSVGSGKLYGGYFTSDGTGQFNHALGLGSGDIDINNQVGTAGQVLTTQGANNVPTWTTPVSLSSTQTWTAQQTFNNSVIISTTIGLGSLGAVGTAGQVIQSNGGTSAPTWATLTGATLSSTQAFTGGNTFVSSVTFSSTVVFNASGGTSFQYTEGSDANMWAPAAGKINFSASTSSNALVTTYGTNPSTFVVITSSITPVAGQFPMFASNGPNSWVVISSVPAGSGGGTGDMVLASTQTNTGQKTFTSPEVFTSSVVFSSYTVLTSSGSSSALKINANGTYGTTNGTSGGLLVDCTGGGSAGGMCTQIYSNAGTQNALGGLLNIVNDNSAYNEPMQYFQDASSTNGHPQIRIDALAPNIEMINTSLGGSVKYEPAAIPAAGDYLQVNGRDSGNSTFEGLARWHRKGGSGNGALGFVALQLMTTGQLVLNDSTDNHYVSLRASNTVSSNLSLILPSADGSNGQALTTNGSGVLSFQTPSGAGDVLKASTQTFTGGNTFQSSTTFAGTVVYSSNVILSGSQGTSGQVFTTGVGGAPTWTTIAGSGDMILASTQVVTGAKTFQSSSTFNGTVDIETNTALSGSFGTAGQFYTSQGANAKPTWTTGAGASVMYSTNTISIPCPSAFRLENGFGINTSTNTGTINYLTCSLDNSATQYVNADFFTPDNLNTSGTVTFKMIGRSSTAAGSKNVAFQLSHQALGSNGDLSTAYKISNSGALAVSATQGQLDVLSWQVSVSSLGWTANNEVLFNVGRDTTTTNNLASPWYGNLISISLPTKTSSSF